MASTTTASSNFDKTGLLPAASEDHPVPQGLRGRNWIALPLGVRLFGDGHILRQLRDIITSARGCIDHNLDRFHPLQQLRIFNKATVLENAVPRDQEKARRHLAV